MTFDDDMVRLNLLVGATTLPIKNLGLEWPPPEHLWLTQHGVEALTPAEVDALTEDQRKGVLQRVSMSQLTDDERASIDYVIRGAEYRYLTEIEKEEPR